MRQICILGSTGSIGRQALEVCEARGFSVAGLAARSSVRELAEQIKRLHPSKACIFEREKYQELKALVSNTNVEIVVGMEGLCELAAMEASDLLLNAMVGMVGLEPTLAALGAKKPVALANKETLVTGGALVMAAARENGVPVLPVDSEHSAIFQCLRGNAGAQVKRLILTASGGPFFGRTAEQLAGVTIQQALTHPNWSMGAKITVDCATLMNKGLEQMEAGWLFGQPAERIEIVIHRESVVHSLVEYADNAVLAQLGAPDMKLPIQYALTYPDRLPCGAPRLSLVECGPLTFGTPDRDTFRCLPACEEAMRRGGLAPTVVNGANEEAVRFFLAGEIAFLEIGRLVEGSLSLSCAGEVTLGNIQAADRAAREYVTAHRRQR